MLGNIESRRRIQQRMRWLDVIIDSMDMSLSKRWVMVKDSKDWHAAVRGVTMLDMTERLNNNKTNKQKCGQVFKFHKMKYTYYYIKFLIMPFISSVQFSHSVGSDSLQPHRLQHVKLPYPSPTPGACSDSCPSSW